MLTAAGRALALAGIALAGLGLAFANLAWVAAASFPLLVVAAAYAARPRGGAARRRVSTTTPRRGDAIEVVAVVSIPAGRGYVEAWQKLPEEFELVEGSNYRLFPLERRAREAEWRFSFRATRRGPAEIPPLSLEWHDPLGLVAPRAASFAATVVLDVLPRVVRVARVRDVRTRASRLVPEGDTAPVGPPGTDFHEIRDYAWGDAPRSINWKATARRLSRANEGVPLVNEYKKEGKKDVWIFLDAGAAMDVGTSLETALDHASEGVTAVASYYLERGYAVGLAPFDAKPSDPLWPDAGRAHLRRITRRVAELERGPREGLGPAVDRARRWFRGGRPLVLVLTRLTEDDSSRVEGIARLSSATKGRAPILVLDVRPRTRLDLDGATDVLDALDSAAAAAARSRGATVVAWRPGEERLEAALLRGVRHLASTAWRRAIVA